MVNERLIKPLRNGRVLKVLLICVLCGFFGFSDAHSQRLVQDSLVLEVRPPAVQAQPHAKIRILHDRRPVSDPALLDMGETKHFLLVPVDLRIQADRPLTDLIREAIPEPAAADSPEIGLALTRFELDVQTFFLFLERYAVRASMHILQPGSQDSLRSAGELLFDSGVTRCAFGSNYKRDTAASVERWLADLGRDLASVRPDKLKDSKVQPGNFRPFRSDPPWMQLRPGCEFLLTPDGLLLDGYVHFLYPESRALFLDSAPIIRYRNHERFDALEYSLMNTLIHYRLNETFLMLFRFSLLFGFNRWKDMSTAEHSLQDALIGDASFTQSLHYSPKNTRSLTFGLGLFQSLYWIDSIGSRMQPGLNLHIGMKL